MRGSRAIYVAALSLALALAGCGDDDGDGAADAASGGPDGPVGGPDGGGGPDAGPPADAGPFGVTLTETIPASPSPDPTPDVHGAAGVGCETLEIYDDASSVLASGAVTAGAFVINVPLAINATTNLRGRCRDGTGQASEFSNSLAYTHDDLPPPAPVIVGSVPSSPAAELRPTITGTVMSSDCAVVEVRDGAGTAYGEDAAGAGTFSVALAIDVATDATTTLTARCVDLAGNTSGNSNAYDYVHSTASASAPIITGSVPASPSANPNPTITGTTPAAGCATVEVWKGSGVTMLASGAPVGTAFNLPVAVDSNATTELRARCLDAGGMPSPWSGPYLYVHDNVDPAAPTITMVSPASPSSDATPEVTGTAPLDCVSLAIIDGGSGVTIGMGAPAAGAFTVTAAVPLNVTTQLRARCSDAAGNPSSDSSAVAYTHDDTPPAPPTITGTNPPSPSSTSMPQVQGTADATCTLVEVWNTTAGLGSATPSGGTWTIVVLVATDATTTLRARCRDAAGNWSGYSATVDYVHSSTIAGPPTLTGTNPASPGTVTNPMVLGTAPAALCDTVEIWYDMLAKLAEGPAVGGTFAITITVTSNTTTTLRGRCRSSGGMLSGFSSAITYTHDGINPPLPTKGSPPFSPASPSNDLTPNMVGTISSPDCAIVEVWRNSPEEWLAEAPTAYPNWSVTFNATANDDTFVKARCRDLAGRLSGFTLSSGYTHDDVPPEAPTLTGTTPVSPSTDQTPVVSGMRGSTNPSCSIVEIWDGTSKLGEGPTSTIFNITVTVAANATTPLLARCRDTAGNVSGFSSPIFYTHDDIVPMPPVITGSTPPTPGNDSTPIIDGTASDPDCVVVEIYIGATKKGEGAVGVGEFHVQSTGALSPCLGGVTSVFNYVARCRDAGGAVSANSAPFTYTCDTAAPSTAPAITGTDPPSPGTINNPLVLGTASSADCVYIDVRDCGLSGSCEVMPGGTPPTGPLLGTATRLGDGSWSIAVTVTAMTTTFKAYCRDLAGNQKGPSGGYSYTWDGTAPPEPSITGTNPVSPSNNATPIVQGTKAGSCDNVEIWDDYGFITEANLPSLTTFSIATPVATNVTSNLYARCRDAAGNVSGYSSGFPYTHDNIAPAPPTIDYTVPASPSQDSSPDLYGTAPTDVTPDGFVDCVTVEIYRNGSKIHDVSHDGSGAWFRLGASFDTNNGTRTFTAKCRDAAGNQSGPSEGLDYTADNLGPIAPTFDGFTPTCGVTDPVAGGTAPSDCATVVLVHGFTPSTVYGTTTHDGSGTWSMPLTVGGDIFAKAKCVDAAGNESLGFSGSVTYYFTCP